MERMTPDPRPCVYCADPDPGHYCGTCDAPVCSECSTYNPEAGERFCDELHQHACYNRYAAAAKRYRESVERWHREHTK